MADKTSPSRSIAANPFTPEFGRVPPYFAGRERILEDLLALFEEPAANPCALFVGARGSGKTALITYLGNEASRLGWIVADVSAVSGMLEDIIQRTEEEAAHLIDVDASRRISSVSLSGLGGISWNTEHVVEPNWRTRMNTLLDALSDRGAGLLITVDEVDVSLDEMSKLVSFYQHFVRENRRVGLIMAGLPFNILSLLNGRSTSFLRRAQRFNLEPLAAFEVEEAFRLTIEDGGRLIDGAALAEAVRVIDGFPFMLQLLGYRAWRAHPDAAAISLDDVRAGAATAQRELESRIFDVTYAELSKADRAFLHAMLLDDGESSRADLMRRLDKPSAHISTYKKRLIQDGVIGETPEGNLRFALPGFREYLAKL